MQNKLVIEVDKASDTPVYRQIVEKLISLVKNGDLSPGDRLPPEREFAIQLGVARGTVGKAYDNLVKNNVIENSQGRGTFVSAGQNVHVEGRKERAVHLINSTIAQLEQLKFSHREIGTLFHLLLMEREQALENIHIAAIDCNPEALAVFEEQLRHLSNMQLVKFLLHDILDDPGGEQKLNEYDILLCTTTHYTQLTERFPSLKEKFVQAAVSPSQQTIIDLATISATARTAIVCRSEQFLQIIKNKLEDFSIAPQSVVSAFENEEPDLDSFLADYDVLILPPDSPILSETGNVQALRRFRERGGRIIEFTYQMERGTLIHIEERISSIVDGDPI